MIIYEGTTLLLMGITAILGLLAFLTPFVIVVAIATKFEGWLRVSLITVAVLLSPYIMALFMHYDLQLFDYSNARHFAQLKNESNR